MAFQTFNQGDDVQLFVDVLNELLAPVDLTTAINIIVSLGVEDENGVIHDDLYKYSLLTMGGYGRLIYPGAPTNQVVVELTRRESKNLPVGLLRECIIVEFPNAFFTTLRERKNYLYPSIGRVNAGCGLNILIP